MTTSKPDKIELEQAFEKLQESEAKYRAIFEASKVGLALCKMDGTLVECNQAYLDIIEYSQDEAAKLTYWDLTPREYESEETKQLLSLEETGGYGPYEKHYISKTGKKRPVLLNGTLLKGADGEDYIWSIVQDISDRKYIEESLQNALKSAESANNSKSEFMSSMSHELRTPMNAIIGFAQLLELNSNDPLSSQQQKYVDHILGGGKHLLELIEQVLDLTKIEAGKIKITIEDIELNPFCDECLALIETQAKDRGLEVVTDLGVKSVYIKADFTRLKQALLNLLSNAIKYNHEGGKLTLMCKEMPDDRVRVIVTDTGEGIHQKMQSGVFEPFNRLGKETSTTTGTGIGLTITKQLVESMGGQVGFVSEPGKGSSFWIDFPQYNVTLNASHSQTENRTQDQSQEFSLHGTLLYVEDDPSHRHLIEETLSQYKGLTFISAHNAELGLAMAEEQQPDIILMDINLPGMSGTEAVVRVKENEKIKHIPMIAVTARAMVPEVKKGLEAGFKAYLTKPFDIPELLKAIHKELP